MYRKFFKRFLDVICAFFAIILLSPVLLVVAILVRTKLGSPVIFKQQRPGYKEKIFTVLKFRTMTDQRNESGELLPDEIRLTKFGKWLRSTSLDELPELINILKGEMSFIGPRPLLVQYLPHYSPEQRTRHDVLPGLTGLAQVNGRSNLEWDERFLLDIWYVQHLSFVLDVKILFLTAYKVIKKEDTDLNTNVFSGSAKK